ncbi:DinB family protein [uncultured Flavobacterium sp.]|uniref:DinB family protein n=1 Tax=uncultured Flavobacterium sp. TaxID=165435 RepID=UPI0030ED1983
MKDKIKAFKLLLNEINVLGSTNSIADFELKMSNDKWSKKEILGHLIDSALNNIQRFTEIQFTAKPYKVRSYNQNELVLANAYQNKDNQELLNLWLQVNNHILCLINNQTPETLAFELILPNGEKKNLAFLIEDYLDHFYHHIKQINTKWI